MQSSQFWTNNSKSLNYYTALFTKYLFYYITKDISKQSRHHQSKKNCKSVRKRSLIDFKEQFSAFGLKFFLTIQQRKKYIFNICF